MAPWTTGQNTSTTLIYILSFWAYDLIYMHTLPDAKIKRESISPLSAVKWSINRGSVKKALALMFARTNTHAFTFMLIMLLKIHLFTVHYAPPFSSWPRHCTSIHSIKILSLPIPNVQTTSIAFLLLSQ